MKDLTREDYVALFNKAAGNKTFAQGGDYSLQSSLFAEELDELYHAIYWYIQGPNDTTRANMVKEWADVQVTLSNLAWFFDIDGTVAFNRVHNNNMTKLIDGKIVRDENGKVLKPLDYVPVNMEGI